MPRRVQPWFARQSAQAGTKRYRPRLEPLESRETPAFPLGIGSTLADVGNAMATDAAGNVYVTGSYQGTVDFDPGTATTNLTSAGSSDVFVAKYNSAGTLVWARSMGGTGADVGIAIALDGTGNVHVTGSFSATGDFDPGVGTTNLVSAGSTDIFVVKLSTTGTFVWAGRMGGTGIDEGNGITVDATGNVYVTGTYRNSVVDFDPGPGTSNLPDRTNNVFVVKWDSARNFVWARHLDDFGQGIAVDGSGNVITTGYFNATEDFDPGPGIFNMTAVLTDAFISKLDNSGNFVWARQLGATLTTVANGIAVDAAGNVYTIGYFNATADMDPGTSTLTFTSAGSNDIFVSKLDTNGTLVWARQIGGTGDDQGLSLVVDGSGNVFTTGLFTGTVDFDPAGGTFNLTSAGSTDIFVSQLDSAGNFVWAGQMGGTGADQGQGIALDATGKIYVTGIFRATADFAPGPGTDNLTSAGNTDIFIARLPGIIINDTGGSTSVTEGGATDTYTVVLDYLPSANVIVTLNPGSQLVVTPAATLTFTSANYNTPQTVTVAATNNFITEGTHTSTITHTVTSTDTRYTAIPVATVTASIQDGAGVVVTQTGSTAVSEAGLTDTYTVVLNTLPTADVLITLSPNSQVTVGPTTTLTFTTVNWNTAQTVTVTAVNDFAAEGPHTGVITQTLTSADAIYNAITISNLTASITDNDVASIALVQTSGSTTVSESGVTDTYTLVLTSLPSADVVVNLNGGAQLTAGPSPLTFTTFDWNVPQTVTVTAIDDQVAEGFHTGVINHTVTSADSQYNGFAIANVTAGIADNDVAGVIVTPTGASTDVTEGGATDTYTLVLNSRPTANIVITLTPNAQLTVAPTRMTFTSVNWNTPQTATVTAVNDIVVEGPHTGVIAHTIGATGDAFYNSGLSISGITANITDNDIPGFSLVETGGSTDLAEGGATDSYTLVLTARPGATVFITLHPDAQVSVSPSILSFTTLNWNVPRTVIVRAVDDRTFEGNHLGVITHTESSADPLYTGLPIPSVTANIADNDAAGVVVTRTGPATVIEGLSTTYTLVLTSQPTDLVTINLGRNSQVVTSPTTSLTFDTGNWFTPRTVTVTSINDSFVEGAQIGIVTHDVDSPDPLYHGVAASDFSVNIIDNDGPRVQGTAGPDKIVVQTSTDRSQILVKVGTNVTTFDVDKITQLSIYAGEGADAIQITDCPVSILIDGGLGVDVVTVNGQAGINNVFALDSFTLTANDVGVTCWSVENLIASGKELDDSFTVAAMPAFAVEFRGDKGVNQVVGPDVPNTWNISNINSGTLNATVKLTSIQSLTGGNVADTFKFVAAKSVSGVIDGGGGANVLDYSLYATPVAVNLATATATATSGIVRITSLIGGRGVDQIIGPNQSSRWTITAAGSGDVNDVVLFQGFENLLGNAADDTFKFTAPLGLKTKVGGGIGPGLNTLDYSSFAGNVTVNLQAKTATAAGIIDGIQAVIGGTGIQSLIAANRPNNWTLNAAGTGTIVNDMGTFTFTDMDNLTGGAASDTFTGTAPWTGALNGGAGIDTLNGALSAAVTDHVWSITGAGSGTLDGLPFANFENLIGTAGDDTFRFAAGKGVTGKINGAGGFNTLDLAAYATPVTIGLTGSTATGTGGYLNVQNFVAGVSLKNAFIATNQSNAWSLSGTNAGDVNGIFFAGFSNLYGGTLDDTFTLDAAGIWSGLLDGNKGTDNLIGPAGRPHIYSIINGATSGYLNGRRFVNIETRS